jgi:hypothetical protein
MKSIKIKKHLSFPQYVRNLKIIAITNNENLKHVFYRAGNLGLNGIPHLIFHKRKEDSNREH